MEITIRPAKLSDNTDIGKFLFVQAEQEDIKKDLEKDLQKMERGEVLRVVAEVKGKVIGQCDFRRSPSAAKQHVVDVTGLVVNSGYQGKGISSRLMEYGFKWAKQRGISMATISVRKGTPAETIYLHQGLKIYGELKAGIKETWGEKQAYDEVLLVKNLR